MKQIVGIVILGAAMLAAGNVLAAEASAHEDLAPSGRGMARGLVNMATGWLEIPRMVTYESTRIHWSIGWLPGIVEGAFVAVGRGVVGTADVLTLGYAGDGVHSPGGALPDYVWEARWIVRDEN